MRLAKFNDFKEKITHKGAILFIDKNVIDYYTGLIIEKGLLIILKNETILLSNNIQFHKEIKIICSGDFSKHIVQYLESVGIKKIYTNFETISYKLFNVLSQSLEVYHADYENTLKKLDVDQFILNINAKILKEIIAELLENINLECSYREIIRMYYKICYKYDIDDCFISIISSNGLICNSNEVLLNNEDLYFVDCGIKYKNLYSDFTFCLKFNELTSFEKECLDFIMFIQDEISSRVSTTVSPKELIEGLRRDNKTNDLMNYLENGFGHSIGVELHEEFTVSEYENRRFKNNMFFTIEPLLLIKDAKVERVFRLESTYTFFNNQVENHFKDIPLVVIKDKL